MPNPAACKQQSGFTLIELIVVVVIIGVMASFVVLSINLGHSDEVKQEARRLKALIELAAQESLLNIEELGIRFNEKGYDFYSLNHDGDKAEWQPLADDEHLSKPRVFSEQIELELYVEGRFFDISNPLESGVHIYLLSSGEMTPFKLMMIQSESGAGYHLTGSITGKLKLQQKDANDV